MSARSAIRAATAAWLCDVPLQGGKPWPGCAAAAPGFRSLYEVYHHPGRLAGLPRLRGPGRVDPGLIVEGFALSGAATGQRGQAVALLAWLCRAPDAPVRADPGGKRRVRRAED